MNDVRRLLLEQLKIYPALQPRDALKALYQSEFGCEHFVSDEKSGVDLISNELRNPRAGRYARHLVEPLGYRFSRVHLAASRKTGLNPATLFRLFLLTSRLEPPDADAFTAKLRVFHDMCVSGELPFDPAAARSLISSYNGPISHTDVFRRLYAPAYRVIRADFCPFLPLFCRIDAELAKRARVIMAIDGNCGAGKTTLALLLKDIYDDCDALHMDDFFLRPELKTRERLAKPGGNVDYERFKSEVLDPLVSGSAFSYRPYDCGAQKLSAPVAFEPKRLNVVEGSYSMHPSLAGAYDFSVFLKISADKRKERILQRDGAEKLDRFINEWIPLENLYFEGTRTEARCDMVILNSV
ncbi:MAG: hypothetical protein LBL35_04135 [Clostridiales bacterium]|jgi:uridine kinase|nr:hypothetical protein [Clostridiales bacterium]